MFLVIVDGLFPAAGEPVSCRKEYANPNPPSSHLSRLPIFRLSKDRLAGLPCTGWYTAQNVELLVYSAYSLLVSQKEKENVIGG